MPEAPEARGPAVRDVSKPTLPSPDPRWIARLQQALDAWYLANARDLPWRRTRDPYRIWLSEAMLQQTRVETVIPYYERFVARFPSAQALADADEESVLKEWAGLGYYSRARNLKRAAEIVVRDHAGKLPESADELAKLPGVGPYTVGAIRSIAFGRPAALVDGNVARVFARLFAHPSLAPAALWELAERLVPQAHPERFNQALMELGATCCTPKAPSCDVCPVTKLCRGYASGQPEVYPAPKKRTAPKPVSAHAAVIERATRPIRLLVVRRPSRGLLGGLWELPSFELAPSDSGPAESLSTAVLARLGLELEPREEIGEIRHVFSHRVLTLTLVRCRLTNPKQYRVDLDPDLDQEARWCSSEELAELPLSRLMQKALAAL